MSPRGGVRGALRESGPAGRGTLHSGVRGARSWEQLVARAGVRPSQGAVAAWVTGAESHGR